jgi:hypothetical protein
MNISVISFAVCILLLTHKLLEHHEHSTMNRGAQSFLDTQELPQHSRCQKGKMKQVPPPKDPQILGASTEF